MTDRKIFKVEEHLSHFSVRHIRTGRTHVMGDGVDQILDDDSNTMTPGSPGFIQTWEDCLNQDPWETLRAYFPDLDLDDDLENPT